MQRVVSLSLSLPRSIGALFLRGMHNFSSTFQMLSLARPGRLIVSSTSSLFPALPFSSISTTPQFIAPASCHQPRWFSSTLTARYDDDQSRSSRTRYTRTRNDSNDRSQSTRSRSFGGGNQRTSFGIHGKFQRNTDGGYDSERKFTKRTDSSEMYGQNRGCYNVSFSLIPSWSRHELMPSFIISSVVTVSTRA